MGRLRVTCVAAAVALSLVVSGCAGSVGSADVDIQSGGDWDPQSLPAIPVNPGGAGARLPSYPNSVVTAEQGLAVSLQPTLQVPSGKQANGYQFTIMTVGGSQSSPVWSGSTSGNSVQVPAGVLKQGNTYVWQAVETGTDTTLGPYAMLVDTERSGLQPSQAFGPYGVDLASGALTLSMGMRAVAGASGKLGVSLMFQAGQDPSEGLPAGWTMQAPGQGWSHLQTYSTGAVSLVSSTGMVTAYAASADGLSYSPVAPAGRAAPTGEAPTLAKNSDGTWSATMASGLVSSFGAVNESGVGYLIDSYNGTAANPKYELTDGKITTVRDSIAADQFVSVVYQGSGDCPDVPDGFASTPDGGLCELAYPDGSQTEFFYLTGQNGQPLLSRIVDYPQTQDSKATVTDIGYDQAQRVVAIREPQAANAQASGVRSDQAALLSTVTYDPQGRVATVTKPAAQTGSAQPVYSIAYNPSEGTSTVSRNGPATTTGYQSKVVYDRDTLLTLSTTDAAGLSTHQTWDTSDDRKLTEKDPFGQTMQYAYNSDNQLSSITGPFTGEKPDSATPTESYLYDQDLSQPAYPRDMHGFNVTYWPNDSLTGQPSGRTFGPVMDAGRIPEAVDFRWGNPPTGAAGPWSARFTGVLTTTAKPKPKAKTAPVYQFSFGGSVKVWIDDVACVSPQGNSECSVPLAAGDHAIRIDLAVANEDGEGGFNVAWAPPGANSATAIPMSSIGPDYGLTSVVTKNDAFSATQPYPAKLMSQFDSPALAKPTSSWVSEASQLRGEADYESFAPDQGLYGRPTSSTLPAGNSSSYTYYGADEQVDVPCDDMGSINQYGRPQSVTRSVPASSSAAPTAPGSTSSPSPDPSPSSGSSQTQVYSNYYDLMGRMIAAQINSQAAACSYFNDAGELSKKVIPARGSQPETVIQNLELVDGSPLKTAMKATVGSDTYTATAESDLYGRALKSTDIWGTVEINTYDDYSGALLTSTVTTSSGYSTTSANTYSPDGQLASVSVDGTTVATLAPRLTSSAQRITYGNGVQQVLTVGSNGALAAQEWTTSDKKTFMYAPGTAPSGRIVNEQFTFDTDQARFDYTYDTSGRLVNSALNTQLPVTNKNWVYSFGPNAEGSNPNAGLNSNRTSQIVDGVTTTYGYNQVDQLTGSSDPAIGSDVSYSDLGEINQLGSLIIDYSSGGQAVRVADSDSGDELTYRRLAGPVIEKTSKSSAGTFTQRYTKAGLVLDGNNVPQWQSIALPGAATLLRQVGPGQVGAAGQQWLHQTVRGQQMWVSDNSGKDAGTRHLYGPFGADLLAVPSPSPTPSPTGSPSATATPSPAGSTPASVGEAGSRPTEHGPIETSTPSAATTSASPRTKPTAEVTPTPTPTATYTSTPTSTESPTGVPTPTPGAQGPPPNYQWQAGFGNETQQVGKIALIDMGARLYVPALGRFTTPDPVNQGSINAYDYGDQDPINQADPTGTMPNWFKDVLSVAITVAAMAVTEVATDGLASVGIAADAATIFGRTAYIASSMLVTGLTTIGSDYLSNLVFYPNGKPFYKNAEQMIMLTLSVAVSGYMARGAVMAASAKNAITSTASSALASASEAVSSASSAAKEALSTGMEKAAAVIKSDDTQALIQTTKIGAAGAGLGYACAAAMACNPATLPVAAAAGVGAALGGRSIFNSARTWWLSGGRTSSSAAAEEDIDDPFAG